MVVLLCFVEEDGAGAVVGHVGALQSRLHAFIALLNNGSYLHVEQQAVPGYGSLFIKPDQGPCVNTVWAHQRKGIYS